MKNLLLQTIDPPALRAWRAQALAASLRAFMLLTLLPLLLLIASAVRRGQADTLTLDLVVYLCFGLLAVVPWPAHQWRAAIFLAVALGYSCYAIALRGPAAMGWFFIAAAVVMAALLLGRSAAALTWLGGAAALVAGIAGYLGGGLPGAGPYALDSGTPLYLAGRAVMTLGISGLLAGMIIALLSFLSASMRATERALAERDAVNRSLEQRVAERTHALHASETKYKVLFQTLPTGVSLTDSAGTIIDSNPASEHLLGIDHAAQNGRSIFGQAWQIVRPDGTPMPVDEYASVRAIREGRRVDDVEMGVARPDGGLTWLSVSAAPLGLPGYGVAVVYSDISARRRADQARAASEAQLLALRDALPDLLFVVRADGTFLEYHAPRVDELWMPPEQFLGRKIDELMPPDVAEAAMATIGQVRAEGGVGLFEYAVPSLGEGLTYEARVVQIAGDELMVLIRDISERERATAALLQAKEAAEAADRAKSTFLAHVSHEIRTPLTAIIGMASLLRGADLPRGARESAAVIHTSAEALLNIIGNILDFSKIESGQFDLVSEPFDLHACCRGTLAMVDLEAREKGLTLSCAIGPGVPRYAIGDAIRIRQVLLNLLGNAVKFTDAGAITLGAEGRPRAAGGVELRLTISDQGPGIAPESMPLIFHPFVQADHTSTRRYGGTGLGLTISRQLVELMGGQIEVASTLGQGSTFTVTLPLAAAPDRAPAGPARQAAAEAAPPPGLRLLIAEDNPVNQEVLARLVGALGYTCDVVGTGAEALRAVGLRPYDVVLMDIQMPELDGEEATRRIRALPEIAQPYIIALTASTVAGSRERYLATGIDAYLSKPVTIEDLRGAIERGRPVEQPAVPPAPTAGPGPQGELVDWPLLDKLLASLGMPPPLAAAMILDLCRSQLALQLDQLDAAAAAGDSELVRVYAHKLCGGSRQIGALALAACGTELEAAALGADIPAATGLLARARETHAATLAALAERLRE